MAIRRIYETPDPVLRQISKPVETFDAALKTLVADMFETMYEAPGIGLAAVQVGEPIRLLVIDLQEPENPEDPESKPVRDPRVFINPEILWHSDTEVPYTEGCLSVPEQYAEVLRPESFIAGRPPVLFVGQLTDHGVGPHPIPQYEVHFLDGARPDVVAAIESSGLRALVHPLTDDDLADHTTLAHWIGEPVELDVS